MGVVDLIFPRKCFGCSKEAKYICSSCVAKLKSPKSICPMCERPSIDGMTHVGCKKPLAMDGLISLWNYEGPVRGAIIALKYKFASDIASELAEACVNSLHATNYLLSATSVLVPIPLYWYRKNWRGFNQAEQIGKLIAHKMKWKFEPDLLIRKKSKVPQASLKMKQRSANIQGVFALNPNHLVPNPYREAASSAYCFVLFDDVWTTGSTLKEAAKILKRVGAKKVWGLTIAR